MRRIARLIQGAKNFRAFLTQVKTHDHIMAILARPRNQEEGRLLRHGFKAYSQNDEDGILQEIFRRVGTTNRRFVEFGVEDGLENNTLYLLLQGWQGLWIEGNAAHTAVLNARFKSKLASGDLAICNAFVTPQNFNRLLSDHRVPNEIDLLSVDIDGNDYHVLAALDSVSPRVVVVEYNAKMHPPLRWVMKFNANHRWDGTDYFGASLTSLTALLDSRGYSLVGCNITGVNAFFIRNDLPLDKFLPPFTAENHYESARYFLTFGFVSGHPAAFGDHEALPDM